MKQKRRLITLLLMMILSILMVTLSCEAKPKTSGIKVQYHSKKQIREYVKEHKFNLLGTVSFTEKPSVKSSYKAGKLKSASLKEGLKALNAMRYIAGIPANVTLNSRYNELCQAAALVNAANGQLSHFPSKPSGMKKALYQLGEEGASSSNIAYASWNTNLAFSVVNQWMEDSDPYNIDRVGHRRWVLNPSMKETGFGYVNGYSAMYAFDRSNSSAKNYGVTWPAQNMPLEFFSDSTAWSISMGTPVNADKIKVTLTRKKDGKKWVFSKKKTNGYFNVENSNYGQVGCIIFRPENITYKSGDTFTVKITGLQNTVSYQVNFFKL